MPRFCQPRSILSLEPHVRYRLPPRCRWLSSYEESLEDFAKEIAALPEVKAVAQLETFLASNPQPEAPNRNYRHILSDSELEITLEAALATFYLHVESRIAALIGKGFYTIGPCGEEALSSVACALRKKDAVALHYRHLGINVARQLLGGADMDQLLLDRARGYTVSRLDPVTGGIHCSIGSSHPTDYVVTSTLASQCPAAVGRALGYSLLQEADHEFSTSSKTLSFVTLGDGSVHNAHFWSAFHLARHARHRSIKCPVVFGISDNGLSISYETHGYVRTLFEHDPLVPIYHVDGQDLRDVYCKTNEAFSYARKHSAPAVILYENITRRFGHAATDRQTTYLSDEQVRLMAESDLLERMAAQVVASHSTLDFDQVLRKATSLRERCRKFFVIASGEPKVNRKIMMRQTMPPLAPIEDHGGLTNSYSSIAFSPLHSSKQEVMRKHMNRVISESMELDPRVVYLGEDVRHGGYYLVTEGIEGRIFDFPPDETSLLGAAMGFSQLGLVPVVEIPYAKYLDCGADMFCELSIMNWLTAGQRPNGMIIRLQGFGQGLFGGNFHTHNQLPHIPPGVHVVCYSNGEDYVKGFRFAMKQARHGHVVVSVDCTALLNLRHLHEKDRAWERPYPALSGGPSATHKTFDSVTRYESDPDAKNVIVSYGNGVVTALRAQKLLQVQHGASVDVIDSPYLSGVPEELRIELEGYDKVIFVDICKEGPGGNVFSGMTATLHSEGALPRSWSVLAAPRAYNPLGSLCTFLNEDDIVQRFTEMASAADA